MLHEVLWAKVDGTERPYPLLAHMLDSAAVAKVLFHQWLRHGLQQKLCSAFGDETAAQVAFVVGLHDLGKASPFFQHQPLQRGSNWGTIRDSLLQAGFPLLPQDREVFSASAETKRHELLSMLALGLDIDSDGQVADSWLQMAIAAHHGRFKVPFSNRSGLHLIKKIHRQFSKGEWVQAHEFLQCQLSLAVGVDNQALPKQIDPPTLILLSGLMVLADRIASNTEWVHKAQRLVDNGELSLDSPRDWYVKREIDALQQIKKSVGIFKNWENQLVAQEAILGKNPPRPLQEEALKVGDGLWNVMAPTGNGKTEAALLRHAGRNERLIFLLPTQATTNAIMKRVQTTFKDTPNVGALAHSLAVTEDFYDQPIETTKVHLNDDWYNDDGGLYPTEFVKSGASRLLAPVCVGTVDQALMGALPTKFNHLRLLALANAHVVVDEVHTMDQYQSELMKGLVQWWSMTDTPVTFLTATMPKWQRNAFRNEFLSECEPDSVNFPSLELWSEHNCSVKELPVESYQIGIELEEVPYDDLMVSHIRWVKEKRAQFPNARIGIICNTVTRAQQLAREFIAETPVLLHSRMSAEHRRCNAEQLEASIGKNGNAESCLVIGTQVIEASLDIDLDLLRTEICPAPSLIQRAGRLWRRDDDKRSSRVPSLTNKTLTVTAVSQADSWQTLPYVSSQIHRVRNWLAAHKGIAFPSDIQDFIDTTTPSLEELALLLDADDTIDEFAKEIQARNQGKSIRIDFKQVLHHAAMNAEVAGITSSEIPDELATRLIEADTIPVILCDSTGIVPGAWTGSIEELAKLKGNNRDGLRSALRASISVPNTPQFKELLAQTEPLPEARSILARYVALPAAKRYYDLVTGLVGSQL